MSIEHRIRVLLTKIGLDTHDVGIELIAQTLRDAGMEVIYLGKFQTPEQIVHSAIQEDVDIIGISTLVVNYDLIIELLNLLKERNISHIPVIVGGRIVPQNVLMLKQAGVSEVFLPSNSLGSMVDYIVSHARKKGAGTIKT